MTLYEIEQKLKEIYPINNTYDSRLFTLINKKILLEKLILKYFGCDLRSIALKYAWNNHYINKNRKRGKYELPYKLNLSYIFKIGWKKEKNELIKKTIIKNRYLCNIFNAKISVLPY